MRVDSGDDGVELDFDLNLAPIIDCFTVLITFLLISASYISINIIEASVASVEVSSEPSLGASGISLTVMAKLNGGYDLVVAGESNESIPVAPSQSAIQQLEEKLGDLQKRWKDTKAITVAGEEDVEYKDVVRVMEMTRKHFTTVLLGGF